MANRRAAEYKPLLFTTTVRNPKRLKSLLWVLRRFNGMLLSDDLATKIVGETIRYGLYRPMKKSLSVEQKWKGTPKGEFADYILSDDEVFYMLGNNPQEHKEAGFARGFPSRFATIFDFAKELGFVYFSPGESIYFSEIGVKMADVFSVQIIDKQIIVEEQHPEYEQQVFLQAMCKSQRANPFVRVLNENVPLILLLEVVKKIDADSEFNNAGISRKEIPLLIFWKDNDAEALYQRIKRLRRQYRYAPSDEVIIDICINEIMGGNYKKFDPRSIMNDYVDEYIRKMRLTGLISLRGAGRFIDINRYENKKVEYVLSKYSTYRKYKTEHEYFNYMAEIDENLFSIEAVHVAKSQSENLLVNWLEAFSWDSIKRELMILAGRKLTKDDVLKFLSAPVRLEFLIALAIKSKLPKVRVIPNYACDDTGLPISTAAGGVGDIECIELQHGVLVEVTMAEGRQQTMMEVWPIDRHLIDFKDKYMQASQAIFVAPTIYYDSQRQIDWLRSDNNSIIRPYKIAEFVQYLELSSYLYAE